MAKKLFIKSYVVDKSNTYQNVFSILTAEESNKFAVAESLPSGRIVTRKAISIRNAFLLISESINKLPGYVPNVLLFDKKYDPDFTDLILYLFEENDDEIENKVRLYWIDKNK